MEMIMAMIDAIGWLFVFVITCWFRLQIWLLNKFVFHTFLYALLFAVLYFIAGPPKKPPIVTAPTKGNSLIYFTMVYWLMLMEYVKVLLMLEIATVLTLLLPVTFGWVWIIVLLYPTNPTIPPSVRITLDILDYTILTLNDLKELVCWFDKTPLLGSRLESKWELVGAVRSSDKGYKAEQFFQVTMCDIDPIDDPFSPDHLSFIHIVEVNQRSVYRRRIVIWRVSLLDGVQQMVHRFDQTFDYFDPQQVNAHIIRDVNCFQSHGVIFVCLPNFMCIHDARYRVSCRYMTPDERPSAIVYLGCIRRLFKVDGSLDGWMIRVVERGFQWENDGRLRIRMINSTVPVIVDLGEKSSSVEEIVFGRIEEQEQDNVWTIRTSRGMGVAVVTDNGPVILFDGSTGRYLYWARFEDALNDDGILQNSSQLPHLDGTSQYISAYLNRREFIKCTRNGLIYRAQFEPPTLKYLAAKRVFNINPKLRCVITVDQFRNATGMENMDAHLVRKM